MGGKYFYFNDGTRNVHTMTRNDHRMAFSNRTEGSNEDSLKLRFSVF